MTYDYELVLIGSTIEKDNIGQEIEVPVTTTILCEVKSIGRNEFYAAAQTGLRPVITFVVNKYEYAGQTKVEFESQEYKVLRTYPVEFEDIELICERVGANG